MVYEIILALIIIGSLILVISGNRKPYVSFFWILFITLLPGVYRHFIADISILSAIKIRRFSRQSRLKNWCFFEKFRYFSSKSRLHFV